MKGRILTPTGAEKKYEHIQESPVDLFELSSDLWVSFYYLRIWF